MMEITVFFIFVVVAITLILLIALSEKSLKRLRNICDILSNGAYTSCPFYVDQKKTGRRWYDENNLKGGENYERNRSS